MAEICILKAVSTGWLEEFWEYVEEKQSMYTPWRHKTTQSRDYTKTDFWKNRFSNYSISKKPVKTSFRIFTKNVIKKQRKYIYTYFKVCI